jgi:Zn-dependent peptidase ImmA (M78 family)
MRKKVSTKSKKLKAPYIPVNTIHEKADEFRKKYTDGTIPIDIERIVEFSLGLSIQPIPGLYEIDEIECFILTDFKTIVVDEDRYTKESYQPRFRFSLAHEVGHYVLHQALYKQLEFTSEEEYMQVINDIPPIEYHWIEWQADEFAGRLLVPPDILRQEFELAKEIAMKEGLSKDALKSSEAADYLAVKICRKFHVSRQVINIRLEREKILP